MVSIFINLITKIIQNFSLLVTLKRNSKFFSLCSYTYCIASQQLSIYILKVIILPAQLPIPI